MMLIKFLIFISYDKLFSLSQYKKYRKIKGGYWEKWYIDCIHSELWFERKIEQIKKKERPGCAFGSPTVEYYDLDYYGVLKKDFDIEKLIRLKKMKSVI